MAWEKIEDATSASYTPVSKDNDACLRVTADYVDGFYDIDVDTEDMMFDKTCGFCPARPWFRDPR